MFANDEDTDTVNAAWRTPLFSPVASLFHIGTFNGTGTGNLPDTACGDGRSGSDFRILDKSVLRPTQVVGPVQKKI